MLGITVARGELTMISFSIVFVLPLTFLLLRSLSAVSNSFYLKLVSILFRLFTYCFFVSVIVSHAFMFAGVTHELSTFPLRVRDMRLSLITLSTFLQAFAPAVNLHCNQSRTSIGFCTSK